MAISQLRSTIWGRLKDLANAKVVWLASSGAAVNGTTGKFIAGPGSLYTDIAGKTIRMNTGTILNPTWGILAADFGRSAQTTARTVAVTGTTDFYVIIPGDGKLSSALFVTENGIPASNSNYIIVSILNLGQDGTGSAAMLTGGPANSSKTMAIAANYPRQLELATNQGDLMVKKNDRLRIRVAVVGTLPNTLDNAQFSLDFQE